MVKYLNGGVDMPGWEKGWDSFLFDSVGTLGAGAGLAGDWEFSEI